MLKTILTQFSFFFQASFVNTVARQSGWVTRSTTRLSGMDFLFLLIQAVNTPTELSLGSFCRILYQQTKGKKFKIQSLWERIVSSKAVKFMEIIYAHVLSIYTNNLQEKAFKIPSSFLKKFSCVYIEDSTVVSLSEKLSAFFKGCGGSASSASLKLHVIFDVISGKFHWIKIIKDKRPDNALVEVAINLLRPQALLIRDLGFFVVDAFKKIIAKGAYFVSRLHPQVNVYLNRDDKKPVDLIQHIKRKYPRHSHGSIEVFIGEEERLPVRLVFYRASEDIINIRKRNVRRNSVKKGRTPSERILRWQEYTIFITNLSEEVAPTDFIGTLYRLRWDIELIFKTWKSHLRLDVLKGTRPERIEVFLYAKLIGILLLGMVCEHLQVLCARMASGWEVSISKVAKLLTSMNFFYGLLKGYLGGVKIEFLSDEYWIQSLCKQKRKRKTTLERISLLEPFWEGFCLA